MNATDQKFFLNDLTDDMNAQQLTLMINWMWVNRFKVSRANIKAWRKANNMDA
jgi:hypothetical protein